MTEDDTHFTVGKTTFFQGEGKSFPMFCVAAGIPCQSAREQASELLGYARYLSIEGLMEDKQPLLWASHYLCAFAKALLDDAELGMAVLHQQRFRPSVS